MLWIDPSGYTSYLGREGHRAGVPSTRWCPRARAGCCRHDRADAGVRPGERAGGRRLLKKKFEKAGVTA
ncbi:MAG: hypothetical protein ACLTMP_00460 [Eggerthella lenta]